MIVSYFGMMAASYGIGSLGGAYFANRDVFQTSEDFADFRMKKRGVNFGLSIIELQLNNGADGIWMVLKLVLRGVHGFRI